MARKVVAIVIAFLFLVPPAYAEPSTHLRQSIASVATDGAAAIARHPSQQRMYARGPAADRGRVIAYLFVMGFATGWLLSGAHTPEGVGRAALVGGALGATAGILVTSR